MDSSDGSNRNPVVICEPPRGLLRVNWAELWKYRELWLTFAARDIKVRYKQTILGALWAILQPLAAMAVFTIVFAYLARLSTDGNPPPVFYYAGLLPWTFFAA
ncbi:MAG: ABC transporter permease, partial [Phycisphaerae bacterium]|nr:ABC transporter permease [Phycisphaerae bacterium]